MVFLLNENIRKYRKANYMSQDELAEKLEVTRQSISLWETGQTQPSLDNIVALAKLFNISTDDLLTDNSTKPVNSGTTQTPPDKPEKKKYILVILCSVIIIALILTVFFGINKSSGPEGNSEISSVVTESTGSEESIESFPESENIQESVPEESSVKISEPVSKPEAAPKNNTQPASTTPESKQISKEPDPVSEVSEVQPKKDLFGYLKNFVIQNGTVNGDYCYYSKSADNYGGYSSENFSLYYWGDTDKIEFCLHSVLDDTFSINFYLYVPKSHTGNYEYISSYYYRDNGEPLYEAKGTITAGKFNKNYPLNCSRYIGSTDKQNDFMEMSRQGICDLIDCLKKFTTVERLDYSFADFGFTQF